MRASKNSRCLSTLTGSVGCDACDGAMRPCLQENFEEDDDFDTAMFEKYRAARLAEMKEEAATAKFGGLRHVTAQAA